ncbi:iron complex transport system permease protein [Geothermobacter ehrlichii]|uniref:Iron complex transport system permease protein n=1 Tax=Geothermobacter ehrlichii TaxID=213224 RepID=A0A5D3WNN9_9BACT|nr:iron ABC transporter permease [Geothermobacter ehrlichii]TYO99269.1 iron complex transport system permease protein [Geothermobacter ehrlichii]
MKRLLWLIFAMTLLGSCLLGSTVIHPFNLTAVERDILFGLRLPRVLFSAVIGAMLGLSGSVYQLTLKNPLADSFTTGAASSAALGAVLAIALGIPLPLVPLVALLTGLGGLLLVYRLARQEGFINPVNMILAGIVMNIVASAVISFAKYYFEDSLSSIVFWLMGGFFVVDWGKLLVCLPVFAAAYLLFARRALQLNLLALDEHSAQSLGVNVHRLRSFAFVVATLLVAVAVSHTGIIGFVGLIVPHICRSLFGSDMRHNLFYSSLLGALLLMAADTLARTIIPGGAELPVGIITALLGGGFFLYLLQTRREGFWHG